jgi:RNA polymerase sigma-70 factor (ECF subfamily)
MRPVEERSDEELVLLMSSGDAAAFKQIYHRYKGLLYIHAFHKLRDEEQAEDIVHDLFAALWDKREHLEITGKLSGYLYTSIRNRIFKLIARKSNEQSYLASITESINAGHCITDHLVRMNMLSEIIEREVAALPAKMRQVFELSRKAGLSHREIAEQLGISEETVKSHITHALKQLRVKLGLFLYLYMSLHYPGGIYSNHVKSSSPQNYFSIKFPPSGGVKGL